MMLAIVQGHARRSPHTTAVMQRRQQQRRQHQRASRSGAAAPRTGSPQSPSTAPIAADRNAPMMVAAVDTMATAGPPASGATACTCATKRRNASLSLTAAFGTTWMRAVRPAARSHARSRPEYRPRSPAAPQCQAQPIELRRQEPHQRRRSPPSACASDAALPAACRSARSPPADQPPAAWAAPARAAPAAHADRRPHIAGGIGRRRGRRRRCSTGASRPAASARAASFAAWSAGTKLARSTCDRPAAAGRSRAASAAACGRVGPQDVDGEGVGHRIV